MQGGITFFYSYPGGIARGTWPTWYVSIRNGYSSGWVDFNSAAIRAFERVTDSGFSLFCGWIFFCCLEMLLSLNIVGITLSLCYDHKISNNALMCADKKDGNNVKSIVAVKQKYIQSLVVLVVADISYKCFLT